MMWQLGSDPLFYKFWRNEVVASMTLIDVLPEGTLYYSDTGNGCTLWVVVGSNSVIVAYEFGESPDQIGSRAREWHHLLTDEAARSAAIHDLGFPQSGQVSGLPVYGAGEDSRTGEVKIAWFSDGDWRGLTGSSRLRKDWHQVPHGWPDSYRDQIDRLASMRVKRSED